FGNQPLAPPSSVPPAHKLAADAAGQQALLLVLEHSSRPIRKTAVRRWIADAVRSSWRDSQAKTRVITEPLQTSMVASKFRLGELERKPGEFRYELGVGLKHDAAFAQETLAAVGKVRSHHLTNFVAGNAASRKFRLNGLHIRDLDQRGRQAETLRVESAEE